MTDDLFRSDNLLVRRVAGHGSHCCVVTFESFTDFRTLDRPGFGEPFLNGHGIDAIHVISRDNDWYQYPETAEAMAVIHAATRGYGRVVTYGSSMGGYAAIRLAGLVGAQAALALSPQYSIDPAVVPWEPRWRPSGERFKDVWESTLDFPALDEAYIVYDPTNRDKKHIALLQAGFQFHPISIPRGGHPVTGFLAEIGLLQQAILALSRGAFDAAEFEREAWARRRQPSLAAIPGHPRAEQRGGPAHSPAGSIARGAADRAWQCQRRLPAWPRTRPRRPVRGVVGDASPFAGDRARPSVSDMGIQLQPRMVRPARRRAGADRGAGGAHRRWQPVFAAVGGVAKPRCRAGCAARYPARTRRFR